MFNAGIYRSILCLNGDLPDLRLLGDHLPIIAADGALNKLVQQNITPALVIGDLDSADKTLLKNHPHLYLPDQSSTDFEKSLAHLKEKNLLPAIVVGIQGGYLDHVLQNINIFLESDSMLYAPPLIGFVIRAGQHKVMSVEANTKLSLFAIPHATVNTTGLKWELNEANLSFPGNASCFNRTVSEEITLTVSDGALLVLIYQTPIVDAGSTHYSS